MVGEPAGSAAVSYSPTATPELRSSSGLLNGRVLRLTPGGLVVDAAGRQIEVSFSAIVDVWKETFVAASALEVGDDLEISGIDGSPFVARHISANIGRIDGVIGDIDATGMLIEVNGPYGPRGSQRVDFSPYIEYGPPDGSVKLTRGDLVIGRAISAVIYGRPGGPLRATRIW